MSTSPGSIIDRWVTRCPGTSAIHLNTHYKQLFLVDFRIFLRYSGSLCSSLLFSFPCSLPNTGARWFCWKLFWVVPRPRSTSKQNTRITGRRGAIFLFYKAVLIRWPLLFFFFCWVLGFGSGVLMMKDVRVLVDVLNTKKGIDKDVFVL